jgi:hypothetical protein
MPKGEACMRQHSHQAIPSEQNSRLVSSDNGNLREVRMADCFLARERQTEKV